MAQSNLQARQRFYVVRCDDGTSLDSGRDHTWDVVDRLTGNIVHNADTRTAARAAAAERNATYRSVVAISQGADA